MQGARTGFRAVCVTVERASATGRDGNHGNRSGIRLNPLKTADSWGKVFFTHLKSVGLSDFSDNVNPSSN